MSWCGAWVAAGWCFQDGASARPYAIGWLAVIVNLLSISAGPCGHGKQRYITLPAGDWEDQEPLIPQPNVDYEHWEKAGSEHQERGEQHMYCTYQMHTNQCIAEGSRLAFNWSDS